MYNLKLAALAIVLVVAEGKVDYIVLDKDVPLAPVQRVEVLYTEQLCRTSRLPAKEVDSGKEQLPEPVDPAEVVGHYSYAELELTALLDKLGRLRT